MGVNDIKRLVQYRKNIVKQKKHFTHSYFAQYKTSLEIGYSANQIQEFGFYGQVLEIVRMQKKPFWEKVSLLKLAQAGPFFTTDETILQSNMSCLMQQITLKIIC